MKAVAAVLILLLAGCASQPNQPIVYGSSMDSVNTEILQDCADAVMEHIQAVPEHRPFADQLFRKCYTDNGVKAI